MLKNSLFGVLIVVALCCFLLVGCSSNKTSDLGSSQSVDTTSGTSTSIVGEVSAKFSENDYYFDWKSKTYTTIDLSKGSVTIDKSGIYEFTGTLKDGTITVNVDKEVDKEPVFLVLNGASVTSNSATPINVIEAKKATILLEKGTTNTVIQGKITTTDDTFPSAAIFSKANLSISGAGTLNVKTEYNDGITSKDNLKITDGNITINSAQDGIVGKDLLAIEKANITITAGKDGMRATNETDEGKGNILIKDGSFTIYAESDGLQAAKNMQIDGGTFTVSTFGGYQGSIKTGRMMGGKGQTNTTTTNTESAKGLKADGAIVINGGTMGLSTYEDAVHAAGEIKITNGTLTIECGDDGIHSDKNIVISGGTINIKNCYEGIESINITMSGGKISVNSSDDGINVSSSKGTLTINSGEIFIKSVGDCMDTNGNFLMTGGKVTADTSSMTPDNNAVDYDGTFSKSGGTIVDTSGKEVDTTKKGPGGMGGGPGGKRPGGR